MVLCGPVQAFAVAVSHILATCPYYDNLQFHILMQVVFSAIITSVTIAVRIRTLSVQKFKLNFVC